MRHNNMKRIFPLSYCVDEITPVYPGNTAVSFAMARQIRNGDSCNTFSLTISNHSGTHIDAPKHFLDSGRAIGEYLFEELNSDKVCIVDCPKNEDELIGPDDLTAISNRNDFDCLLIRTGFSKYRQSRNDIYCEHNPCFTPQAARWLRQNFLDLKLIGIDTISLSSRAHKGVGSEAHRILFDKEGFKGGPILVVEDMMLPGNIKKLDQLVIMPIFGGGIDSSPCAVLGVVHD